MSLCRTALILLALSVDLGATDRAGALFRAGERAQRTGDTFQAYLLYTRAAALAPSNAHYALQRNRLRDWAGLATQVSLGDDPASSALRIVTEGLSPSEVLGGREALPPPRLQASGEKKSFDLRGTARLVFEQVAAAYGIQLEFEDGYQGPASAFTFRMKDLSMEEAFHALETVTNSFLVPVTGKLALVYRDTNQRRTDSAPMMTAEIPIPERITVQEAQEMLTAVQQVLEIRRIAVDPGRRRVFLRDQPGKILAAREILGNLSRGRAQVEIEIELLSVSKTSSLMYGLQLPSSVPILNFGTFLNNAPAAVASLTRFATFGGGATLMGIGIADAEAFATVSRRSAESLVRSEVVALDGQPASLKVGDRYPIITASYVGEGGVSGTAFAPAPAVQFQDLGLTLKVTPTVQGDREITLDVDAEQSVLGGASNNGIPVISSRHFQGLTRLRAGESAVIAGLAVTSISEDRSGIAGLSSIPLLGRLFSRTAKDEEVGQVLIVLKPRLISLPPWESPAPALWVGTETRPLSIY